MNGIYHVSKKTADETIRHLSNNETVFVTIVNGEKIKVFSEYMEYIEEKLHFPRKCDGNTDRYNDWMRDLSWLPYDEYAFFILNEGVFLKDDPKGRILFTDTFQNCILPWWENDVVNHVVGGNRKKMNVYLSGRE